MVGGHNPRPRSQFGETQVWLDQNLIKKRLGFLVFYGTGLPYVRPMPKITAVADADAVIRCPAAGYPLVDIEWMKGTRWRFVDRWRWNSPPSSSQATRCCATATSTRWTTRVCWPSARRAAPTTPASTVAWRATARATRRVATSASTSSVNGSVCLRSCSPPEFSLRTLSRKPYRWWQQQQLGQRSGNVASPSRMVGHCRWVAEKSVRPIRSQRSHLVPSFFGHLPISGGITWVENEVAGNNDDIMDVHSNDVNSNAS